MHFSNPLIWCHKDANDVVCREQRFEAAMTGFVYGFSQSIPQFCFVVSFFYGSHLIRKGEIDFEDIFR